MKTIVHKCDFCGGKVSGKVAQLIVPMSAEEVALRKRAGSAPEVRPSPSSMYAAMFGLDPRTEERTMTYDMCRDCARGLLLCRFRIIAKQMENVDD